MEAKSLLKGSSLKPSYPIHKLSKTTMMTPNCVRFSFNYNSCLIFANGYPSSSLPLSLQNKPRKSASVVVSARRKDKKEDTHSSVPKPDEVTGFFPEAVLLKKRTVEEEGKLLPEFEDADERELFEALMLELDSDMDVDILRHYEVMYLIHEKHEEEVVAVNEKIQDFLREKKGQVWRLNDWGMRRLAYKIKKANNAHYMLINFELDAKYINDFKTLLDQDERVIRHLVIKRDEAITEDCPPPPDFHTLRGNADDDEDEEFDEDYDGDWDGEDEEDGDEGEDDIIFVDGDEDDIDSRKQTSANVRQPDIRKLRAENVSRAIKSTVRGFPRPLLDLSTASFAKVMNSAFGRPLVPPFDPYANSINYLLASYVIPYVGLTGYVGANPLLQNATSKRLVAGLLGVESGQDAVIRALLYEYRTLSVQPYNVTVAEFTNRISMLRNNLGGSGLKDEGLVVPREQGAEGRVTGNILVGDKDSLSYPRTPREILRIIYGGGDEHVPGGFYPKGASGRIAKYYLKTT
ncbi:hypothetical protein JHK82_023889 [Glycine max]|uniref:Uncharacterized protein n=3 Tax=Glycine subgen. Soja TaxID=1462606 RepID=A0A0R0I373_SOYBN|nr:hypothetical protein JHK86_023958 [Glycine max]KAG5132701.1 hypothetical protein JHK82_023889 [Glycine max]KRH36938.1 hypothetical protein GLYMA_09G032900v4 [Glycine max]